MACAYGCGRGEGGFRGATAWEWEGRGGLSGSGSARGGGSGGESREGKAVMDWGSVLKEREEVTVREMEERRPIVGWNGLV